MDTPLPSAGSEGAPGGASKGRRIKALFLKQYNSSKF